MESSDIETLEVGYGITFTDEERRLLITEQPLLSYVDKVHAAMLRRALLPMQCAGCGGAVCRRSCMPVLALDVLLQLDGYQCPHCGVQLIWWASMEDADGQWFELASEQGRAEGSS